MDNTWLMLLLLQLAALLFMPMQAEVLLSDSLAAPTERDVLTVQQELRPAASVLEMLPALARSNFLLYQLAMAINSGLEVEQEQELIVEQQVDSSWLNAMANEFQQIPVDESFPSNFQYWLMDNYGLSPVDVYQSWPPARSARFAASDQDSICNAAGQCYKLAQIVAACCPF